MVVLIVVVVVASAIELVLLLLVVVLLLEADATSIFVGASRNVLNDASVVVLTTIVEVEDEVEVVVPADAELRENEIASSPVASSPPSARNELSDMVEYADREEACPTTRVILPGQHVSHLSGLSGVRGGATYDLPEAAETETLVPHRLDTTWLSGQSESGRPNMSSLHSRTAQSRRGSQRSNPSRPTFSELRGQLT